MHESQGPVLIAYDGSDSAKAAIAKAGKLLEGRSAVVLAAWRPAEIQLSRGNFVPYIPNLGEIDTAEQEEARRLAQEGASIADDAGFSATSRVTRTVGNVADAITGAADELDAEAIVLGSRGRTGAREALLGSVSNRVMHHARQPVLVIHDADIETERPPESIAGASDR